MNRLQFQSCTITVYQEVERRISHVGGNYWELVCGLYIWIFLCLCNKDKVAWKRNTLISHWSHILDPRSQLEGAKDIVFPYTCPLEDRDGPEQNWGAEEEQERKEQFCAFTLQDQPRSASLVATHNKLSSPIMWKLCWREGMHMAEMM